ncbi:unnamed protein product [Ilex paraguariensis]|uniref:THAP4-like heme-binding domain-containing protein n=1 Tax=Ilex paraguariensis TaxID=185542 RepID=A0ABC8V4U6_9AQUA
MENIPKDIYTEPEPAVDTLANLGPLTGMAGIWVGTHGLDVNPKPNGPEKQAFIEHMELQPIDAQTNGPQLFYGLRYHTRIVKPDDVETFHDQVGYWLWEPATGTVIQTLSIPRGQAAMAVGRAEADARTFRLEAVRGSETNGIVSKPVLGICVRTKSYIITVAINVDGTPGGAVPPYGSQHAPEGRRAYAQSDGASGSDQTPEILGPGMSPNIQLNTDLSRQAAPARLAAR